MHDKKRKSARRNVISRRILIGGYTILTILIVTMGILLARNSKHKSEIKSVISSLEENLNAGDLDTAETLIYRALVETPELDFRNNKKFILIQGRIAYQRRVERGEKIEDLSNLVRNGSGIERLRALKTLMILDPENAEFSSNFEEIENSDYEDKQKELDEIRRQKLIDSGFSSWSGSHINLEKFIKESMNDPSSFQHVETKYWDQKDHLLVLTKFRGSNAFGGIVSDWIKAKVTLSGEIIVILERGS